MAIQDNACCKISDLFELAIRTELGLADFYAALAGGFGYMPMAVAFWEELSKDGRHHAEALSQMFNMFGSEYLDLEAESRLFWALRTALSLLSENSLNSIQDLDDAYEMTHEVENSEVNSVFAFLMARVDPNPERKAFVKREIQEHLQKLMSFGRRNGPASARKEIQFRRQD